MEADRDEKGPSGAALRMRRYRKRQKEGVKTCTIEVSGSFIDELVETRRLEPDLRDDRDEVERAVVALLDDAISKVPKLGRCDFELNNRQISILIRRRHLEPSARNSVHHVRRAFAEFVRWAFDRVQDYG